MKNIKTRSYLLGLITIITLGITYAYSSVSDSLTYLRGAGDIGHIGYIITEIFDSGSTSPRIKPQYLPDGMVVQDATTTQTGIVMLEDSTGSLNSTGSNNKVPTISLLSQVWNILNTKAPLESPSFSGTPIAPTPNGDSNTGQIATVGWVKGWVDDKVSAAGTSSSPTCYYTTSSCDTFAKLLDGVYIAGGSSNVSHNICCFMGGTVSPLPSICPNDDLGTNCTGTDGKIVKNMGIFNGYRYMVTPGNCTDSNYPTCNNGTDSLSKKWGTYGITTYISSNDGFYNTKILASYSDSYAAKYCQNMVYGGFDDWYLPSKEELMYLYKIRNVIGGFSDDRYWSSTEASYTDARVMSFPYGAHPQVSKRALHSVRCIRKF